MTKQPKVTVLPPAEQEVFFQEQQFDQALRGTNPIRWWQGNTPSYDSRRKASGYGRKVQQDRLKKAESALKGHENKKEIMKLLRRGGDE